MTCLRTPHLTADYQCHVLYLAHSGPERAVIADWLSPLNFKVTQSDVLKQRADGTGQWLLESPEFQAWLSGLSESMWCPGIREH